MTSKNPTGRLQLIAEMAVSGVRAPTYFACEVVMVSHSDRMTLVDVINREKLIVVIDQDDDYYDTHEDTATGSIHNAEAVLDAIERAGFVIQRAP